MVEASSCIRSEYQIRGTPVFITISVDYKNLHFHLSDKLQTLIWFISRSEVCGTRCLKADQGCRN